MNLLIVGTGALATLFAARLTEAGHSVTMLGTWKRGLKALAVFGARLVDAAGVEHVSHILATHDPDRVGEVKYALVLVKAWQTQRAAQQLFQCLSEDGLAVTLQNGLGNRETLAEVLDQPLITARNIKLENKISEVMPTRSLNSMLTVEAARSRRVAQGVTTTGATLLGPGLVRMGGEGVISIERHPFLGPLEEALRSAGFNVQVVEDVRSLLWGKLVINAAINPLTAILQVSNGELLMRPAAREVMGELARETSAVAKAEGVTLPFHDPAAAAEDVARKTAANHSSMFQDVRRGAPTEIDAICGAIAELGERHGVPTPINRVCWQLVKALVFRDHRE